MEAYRNLPKHRKANSRSRATTRERILHAAVERFARASYEQTGLRDIAADAGVDVAYVHRSFGSKERLFAEAVRAAVQPIDILPGAKDIGTLLATHVIDKPAKNPHGLDIIIRSFSSPEAAPVVREFIVNTFVEPLSRQLNHPAETRATLIGALLIGIAILREVLHSPGLTQPNPDDLKRLITRTIDELMQTTAGETTSRS
ncbi:MAG: TetR family transcriptional regulator [Proteobacteria bacterium]|nr:TetR family transcriptional regulator [Pseudomonadota bacterium]